VAALLAALLLAAAPARGADYEIQAPQVALSGIPFEVTIDGGEPIAPGGALGLRLGGATFPVEAEPDGGLVVREVIAPNRGAIDAELVDGETVVARHTLRVIPAWIAIVPPLLAILVALLTRNVIPALFLGVWAGAVAVNGFSPVGVLTGLLDSFQVYVRNAVADGDRAAVILFSLMIGGMVGIISRNGGMQGLVQRIIPWARTAPRAQVATGTLGLLIFFDDYANVLVVGGTMRNVTDRLRISREKLAYIVDSTAAPVSCIALVTTWIGFEVGLIDAAVDQIDGFDENGYVIFLRSIPYSFYPWLALFFVFLVALSSRDFGPMHQAERRARTTAQLLRPGANVDSTAIDAPGLQPKGDRPQRAVNAVVPVLVLVATVITGLFVTGEGDTMQEIIGSADSYKALMWGSLLGALTAGVLSIAQRVLSLAETVNAWYEGLRSMVLAVIILALAWALSGLTEVLQTAPYLVSVLGDTLPPGAVPALVFVLSAAIAFATGTSWGTMGIVMPLVVPLVWAVLGASGVADPGTHPVIASTVACTLAGAVWGDHCSPISDTTVLSSMASGCDHIDHVRTQLPYALLVGGVALLLGTVPTGLGVPWWMAMPVAVAALVVIHRWLGRPVASEAP
jgi:Na+/H+ antiporter NhaC